MKKQEFDELKETDEENPDPSWIGQDIWKKIVALDKLETFNGISNSFLHSLKEWKQFYYLEKPEQNTLPSDWS